MHSSSRYCGIGALLNGIWTQERTQQRRTVRLDQPKAKLMFLEDHPFFEGCSQQFLAKLAPQIVLKGFYAGADKYNDQFPVCIKAMAEYITNGSVVFDETYEKGFDKFPEAMLGMLAGKNTGKMLVDLR